MRTLITDIAKSIGQDDAALDLVIQAYLDFWGLPDTVSQWRLDNYSELRRWAYPDPADLTDAVVKQDSGDQALIPEGTTQRAQYVADCLAVKTRFPKPY